MTNWTPRAGNEVKLSAYSVMGGNRLINVRIAVISKVTNESIFVIGVRHPFKRKTHARFEEQQPTGFAQGAFTQIIEKPSPHELNQLPRSPEGGSIYAQQINMTRSRR